METHASRLRVIVAAVVALSLLLAAAPAGAEPFAIAEFQRTWERTDKPVSDLLVSRTWMWGPEAFTTVMPEAYAEATGGVRSVQYTDKSRMEDNRWRTNEAPWDVTNGLLAKELITGDMQIGDAAFEDRLPAEVNVAGDPDDDGAPTYATFSMLLDQPAHGDGQTITTWVSRGGTIGEEPSLAQFGVTAAYRVTVPGIDHQVASPFWEFMNSSGLVFENGQTMTDKLFIDPFYATGYPITEAYWSRVVVAGTEKDVLSQCFERRCLTYTPDNPDGWKVEAGNVGRHYYEWRYEQWDGDPPAAGDVMLQSNLGTWSTFDVPGVVRTETVGNEYHSTVFETFGIQWNVTDEAEFPDGLTDYHVTIQVKSLAPDAIGPGCLVAPFIIDDGGTTQYQFCVDHLGTYSVWVERYDPDSNWISTDQLMSYRGSLSSNPWTEWNTLGASVQGTDVWYFVNGDLIGHVTLDAAVVSQVGFAVINLDEDPPIEPIAYAFRNLTVYHLAD